MNGNVIARGTRGNKKVQGTRYKAQGRSKSEDEKEERKGTRHKAQDF